MTQFFNSTTATPQRTNLLIKINIKQMKVDNETEKKIVNMIWLNANLNMVQNP